MKVKITREQYDRAVMKVVAEEMDSLHGEGKLLIPMVGAIFASKIADELFLEKKNLRPAHTEKMADLHFIFRKDR